MMQGGFGRLPLRSKGGNCRAVQHEGRDSQAGTRDIQTGRLVSGLFTTQMSRSAKVNKV